MSSDQQLSPDAAAVSATTTDALATTTTTITDTTLAQHDDRLRRQRSSSPSSPAPPQRGGRGSRGRGSGTRARGRATATSGSRKKRKDDDTTSDEDLNDSSSSDSSTSDDSSDSEDSDSSSSATPARRGGRGGGKKTTATRGRARGAGVGATGRGRGGRAKVNNNTSSSSSSSDSSDSSSSSSAASSDNDVDIDDAANGNQQRPRARLLRPQGVENQVIRDFKQRTTIPFRTAAQDRACFDNRSPADITVFRASLRSTFDSLFTNVHRHAVGGHVCSISDMVGFLDEPVADVNALQISHFIPSVLNADCPCLFSASNYSSANDRFILVKSSFKNGSLMFLGGVYNNTPRHFRTVVRNPGRRVIGFRHKKSAQFERDFGLIRPHDDGDPDGIYDRYVTFGYGNYCGYGIHVLPPKSDQNAPKNNQEAQQWLTTQFEGTRRAGTTRSQYREAICQRSATLLVEKKQNYLSGDDNDEQNRTHAFHHLFIRLRSLESATGTHVFSDSVKVNLQLLGNTRLRVWRHRFIIETLLKCGFKFDSGRRTLKNEMPTFDNLFHEIMTPSALLNVAKEMQSKSAKEIFEFFGSDLVRVRQDVRGVPVRPPGITVDLFPHQRRTVAFMIDREKNGVDSFVHSDPIPLPPTALIRENGQIAPHGKYTHYRFHVNSAFGAFAVTPIGSDADVEIMSRGKHRGGMLADEVGMGKTLSILSLISLNKPTYDTHIIDNADTPIRSFVPESQLPAAQNYKTNLKTKLKIKATLVLAPVSLVGQWEDEIRTRSPNLKVLRYHGSEKKKSITYADFAAADVVITTFETYRLTLRDEAFWFKWFGLCNDKLGGHVLRQAGMTRQVEPAVQAVLEPHANYELNFLRTQFRVLGKNTTRDGVRPSAETVFLSRLHFHRIVLDEFHKPGALSDAPLIDSDYLWLVSGTPLDAPIGRFLKRLGVMDFSFVKSDELRFISETADAPFEFHNDNDFFQLLLRRREYKPYLDFSTVWNVDNERLRNYSPPAQFAANYARLAFLSQYMIRNTVDTCPELANVRVTEKIVTVKHSEKEKEKYNDTLEKVRTELDGLRARNALQTRILYVMTLLNNLRRAAVDPFGVTINVRDALAVGGGAQFENENQRRNIHLVPVNIFAHLLFPQDFPLNLKKSGGGGDGAGAADKAYSHVKSVTATGTLKDELEGMLKQPPELESCMICLENLAQPTVTSCGHIFCRECILQWIQRGGAANCPACRKESLGDTKKKSLLTFPPPPQEEEENKNNLLVKKEEPGGENVLKKNKEEDDSKIPTKIKKVMEIVRDSIAEDHTSKFLIFTAFPSVLKFLSDELARASIGSVIIDGSSTLTQRAERIKLFQNLGSFNVRVCIVSSRVGNMGLTLTAANHLIIIEPASNIDVDTQILGRVKRLGQKRAVTCHRLHVEDSIEVPLHQLVQSRTVSLSAGGSEASKKQVTDTILKLVYPNNTVPPAPPAPPAQAQQQYFNGGGGGFNQNNHNNNNNADSGNDSDDENDDDNRNNNGDDGLNAYEREQMAQIARWEREHGVVQNNPQQQQQPAAAAARANNGMMMMNNNNNNNNNNNDWNLLLANNDLTAEERRQLEQIARWERENGVV